jgi:diketogulonate reductase-like aldo/keto reductase
MIGKAEPNVVKDAVLKAFEIGYRHFDCAYVYENEKEIGAAFKETLVPRESYFVTSKLWNTFHDPSKVAKALKDTLNDLSLDYLDLYLIHWPLAFVGDQDGNQIKDPKTKFPIHEQGFTIHDTWKEMEKLVDSGLVNSIGLSNFSISQIKDVMKIARIKPSHLQVSLSC